MRSERTARLLLFLSIAALALGIGVAHPGTARWFSGAPAETVELHASLPESGGWTPADLTVEAGKPLHLRITSDDVMHGFALGQSDRPPLDVVPGEWTETTLVFDRPGKYTYYCNRWCGPNHWRMRGTIRVLPGAAGEPADPAEPIQPPLYVQLGLDLDAPHLDHPRPDQSPSAARGAALGISLPAKYLSREYFLRHSPADLWADLKAEPLGQELSGAQVWDLVAWTWQQNLPPGVLDEGRRLYAASCAACHGEGGGGDGVFADRLARGEDPAMTAGMPSGHQTTRPADFTSPDLLGRSPAELQGKIIRGGMGTGMPYWGPIFTEAQTWALADYLWTFSLLNH